MGGDSAKGDEVVGTVVRWLEAAFPDRHCSKCGHDRFFVLDPPPQPLAAGELTFAAWPVSKLACARCGFVEEYLTGILKRTLETTNFEPLHRETPDE